MNLELTDEQRSLRDTVRRYLADEAPLAEHVRPVAGGAAWTADAAWKGLVDLGATGVLVGSDHGGSGLGMVDAAIVAEELGRALYPGPWLATAVGAARTLAAVGGAGAGELLGSIAGDGARAAVVLDPLPPGLTGRATHVLGAPSADTLLVPIDHGRGELALVAIDATGPGVAVTAEPSVDATTSRGIVELDGPPAVELGLLAPDALAAVRDDVLVAWAADALGAADAVLEIAVGYAKVREQFGQPIGAFQAVQHLCVDMFETVELARGGVLHAAWAADHAEPTERHRAAVRLKAFSDRLATVADTAIQVLGGIGFTWEHDAHLYLKRLLTWSTALGPASSYRVELGKAMVAS